METQQQFLSVPRLLAGIRLPFIPLAVVRFLRGSLLRRRRFGFGFGGDSGGVVVAVLAAPVGLGRPEPDDDGGHVVTAGAVAHRVGGQAGVEQLEQEQTV